MRTTRIMSLAVAAGAVVTVTALPAPSSAQPSCVAQSIVTEHAAYGTAWGHDVIAFLATNPAVVQSLGFTNLGDFVRFTARQDPAACPAE